MVRLVPMRGSSAATAAERPFRSVVPGVGEGNRNGQRLTGQIFPTDEYPSWLNHRSLTEIGRMVMICLTSAFCPFSGVFFVVISVLLGVVAGMRWSAGIVFGV